MEARVNPADFDGVAGLLAACAADLRQGRTMADVLAGSQLFRLDLDGSPAFAWGVRPIGPELWIDAAAGHAPGVDLTRLGFELIETQARGAACDTVAFQTRRRGLVAKARRLGYALDGYILRKNLT